MPNAGPLELTLIDELLEAHADTVQLALDCGATERGPEALRWRAHVDYLRALQRAGHAMRAAHDGAPPATLGASNDESPARRDFRKRLMQRGAT